MKPDDYLTPEIRKMLLQQQKLIEERQDMLKNIPKINSNSYTLALKNMNITNTSFIDSYNEFINSYKQSVKIAEIYKPNLEAIINSNSFDNSSKLSNDFYKNSFNFQKSMDIIYKNNAILGNSISRTIELTKINNSYFNNQLFENITNIFSSLDLNSSKTVLKEFTNILKNSEDAVVNNQKDTEYSNNDIFNVETDNDNDDEFQEILDEIDKQSAPFSISQLKRICTFWINIYSNLVNTYSNIPLIIKFPINILSSDEITKLANYVFNNNLNEITVLIILTIVGFASSKFKNKQK